MTYLDNLPEEALSGDVKIREQHETIKLLNEEARMLQQKYL